ncbi:MAG: hypothetical protein H6603_01985 [Flavobacteriales bacterium]|nr:hypothetical protein [Flavobacteriales bacterium]MCB9203721.1 hypothetical protein [Flavobacteriales bacterium]
MRSLILILLLLPVVSFGQYTMKDFLNQKCDVVWFGLDFSRAKLIGSDGFNNPVAIKEEYFRKWNDLMISESDKYEWGRALSISDLKYDYGMINEVNDQVKVKSLVIDKSYSIPKEEIPSITQAYNITEFKEGIGVVLLVESFNKVREMGFGYIVFFDIQTKDVLYFHELIGEAKGFGFRNYWAGAILNWMKYTKGRVMRDMRKEFH